MKFEASTLISVVVTMAGGVSKRIAFSARSTGGSVYYTNNDAIAAALRRHYKFGKLFKEVKEEKVIKPKEKKAKEPERTVLKFGDLEEAKDEVARRTGISRTKLKTKEALKSAAEAAGYAIEIEDVETM
ncbi:hypothetical protein [Paramuribaculum intestinale]|uniref:hypothetical protein n=1 Tax=Paramuribaculum intestinale TaxID=2094151 RepID=UPI0025A995C9|nr:hypothetical protein [Paramuribaculum intestinale]